MKKFILVALLMLTSNAFATVNQYGDIITGSASVPSAGTVVVDTGSLTPIGLNHDFYNFSFITTCSLACTLEVGIFSSSDVAVSTYTQWVLAGTTVETNLPHVPIINNQKVKIKVSTLNLGTVTGVIALQLLNSD